MFGYVWSCLFERIPLNDALVSVPPSYAWYFHVFSSCVNILGTNAITIT